MSKTIGFQSLGKADFTSASGVAYTAGDCIGTAQKLAAICDCANRVLVLDQILVRDAAAQKKGVRFYFFDANPAAAVDNAPFAIGTSLANLVGFVDFSDGDYAAVDSAGAINAPTKFKMKSASADIWVVAVTKPDAGAPTYGNGGKLSCDFHFSY